MNWTKGPAKLLWNRERRLRARHGFVDSVFFSRQISWTNGSVMP